MKSTTVPVSHYTWETATHRTQTTHKHTHTRTHTHLDLGVKVVWRTLWAFCGVASNNPWFRALLSAHATDYCVCFQL